MKKNEMICKEMDGPEIVMWSKIAQMCECDYPVFSSNLKEVRMCVKQILIGLLI